MRSTSQTYIDIAVDILGAKLMREQKQSHKECQ